MFSAFMTTQSLPFTSSTLPLRTELAIIFTTVRPPSHLEGLNEPRARRSAAGSSNQLGAFYKPFPAAPRSNSARASGTPRHPPEKPLVAAGHPRRPPAVSAG